MNFGLTKYSQKPIFKPKKIIGNHNSKKIAASYSSINFYPKHKKNPLFLRTINHSYINNIKDKKENNLHLKKKNLKKSSTTIFQNNDVDFVRSLNFDSLKKFNDNIQLKENLINSVNINVKIDDEGTLSDEKVETEEVQLPKLNKLSSYKSYELIQTQNKKIKNEISEQLQKELTNKLKIIRADCQNKKLDKEKIFMKIKEINEQLEDIDAENYYFNEQYKQKINSISKKGKESNLKKKEIRFKLNLEKKKKRHNGSLMDIFKYNNKKENNDNNLIQKNNNSNFLNISNIKYDSPLQSGKKLSVSIKDDFKNKDQKGFDNFVLNMMQSQQKKEYENVKKHQYNKIHLLKEEWKKLNKNVNEIDKEIKENKKKEKVIVSRLMTFYKELLFKGKNVKKDGLVWIIKAIWNLGENVPMSFMPEFLDIDSIEYLFKLAHKQLEIENCKKKIKEIKLKLKKEIDDNNILIKRTTNTNKNHNNNYNESNNISNVKSKLLNMKNESETIDNEDQNDAYKDIIRELSKDDLKFDIIKRPEVSYIDKIRNHIEQIERDIIELKKYEINRIYRCFIEYDYENRYHTNIETVLSALIGIDAKDTEMNHFNIEKKNYISTIRKIRFFDHEHTRKVISKNK